MTPDQWREAITIGVGVIAGAVVVMLCAWYDSYKHPEQYK